MNIRNALRAAKPALAASFFAANIRLLESPARTGAWLAYLGGLATSFAFSLRTGLRKQC